MKVQFQPRTELAGDLVHRVESYLSTTDLPRLRARMLRKTAIILAWLVASYVLLVVVAATWWQGALAACSLALAMAAVGFAIEHDANHNAYPVGPRARRALGLTLDLVGASSYVWRYKHNANHHHYTNVPGADGDVDLRPFARLAAVHPRRWYHRWQHLYLWPLYGFLHLKWWLVDDWVSVAIGRIGGNPFPRPRGGELALFVAGKAVAVTLGLGLPLLLHPPLTVLAFVGLTSGLLGVGLAVVFQAAHIVEEAAFPAASGAPPCVEQEFVRHQLATTVDFAPGNRALGWLLGGLNYQVEHHLFPRVCHLQLPAVAALVADVCREHGVTYLCNPTFTAAIRSHYRLLRRLGRAPDCYRSTSARNARIASNERASASGS